MTHDVDLTDRRLAKIVQQCQELPGEDLFHYIDDDGSVSKIYSEDVNEYLREITGQEFTAKDFRTWAGTSHAAVQLESLGPASAETEVKKNLVTAVKAVAAKLGNKPSTCRKYYIHPAVLDSYSSGALFGSMQIECDCSSPHALRREEHCVLKLVQQNMLEQAFIAA